MAPRLVESARHPNIEIITLAEVKAIDGRAGQFKVHLLKKPRYVDEALCTNCGECGQYCPLLVPDSYNESLSTIKNVHIQFLQAVPAAPYIDPNKCLFMRHGVCQICPSACQRRAIDFSQKEEFLTLDVGAVILTPGFSTFDPGRLPAYRYGDAPNVVTGLEFERICCASGPTMGEIIRPSDLKKPDKIAIVLCVGSRDKSCGNEYCSAVCCKYAVKDAIVALEHEPDLDITIFFMDMRMYGKGFETFYRRAKAQGVKFVRSRASEVKEDPATNDLTLKYVTEDGALRKDSFNLVVLAHGLEAPKGNSNLAMATGIGLNQQGFCDVELFSPLDTTREGIFVAGAFQGPKAIPDSVIQAGGAAASAAEVLAPVRGVLAKEKTYPEERSDLGESPRIGVFVCHCGKNIAGVVDVEAVSKYAETLADVVMVERNLYSCSSDTQTLIAETIAKHNLNAVVVAACTPRTHEPLFQDTLREASLNKCLIEMVNIRDQCSWVHAHEKEEATEKSKDLIRMAIAKAREIEPLPEEIIDVAPKGLVIGGGLSGMTAALSLARQGFECCLIERSSELGGSLRQTYFTLEGPDPQKFCEQLIQEVAENEKIHVLTGTDIIEIEGFVGNFETRVLENGKTVTIKHGIIIIATGATSYEPDEYLYGKHGGVLLQQALEQRLAVGEVNPKDLNHVVMIQCVGSRDENHTYCSAICCGQAIKNALKIKEINPDTNVTILYRDVMTFGFREKYYDLARDRGIAFVRFSPEQKPVVEEVDGKLRVTTRDPLMGKNLIIDADLLALSSAMVPYENKALLDQLTVPLSADGFFLESHAQLKPVDSYVDGIYLCGKAQFPKPVDECISHAKAAAAKAALLLGKGHVTAEPIVASCDIKQCIGCGICAHLCPYSAIRMTKMGKVKKAEFVTAACKGCGVCSSYCPTRAIAMGRFTDGQIGRQIKAFGELIASVG